MNQTLSNIAKLSKRPKRLAVVLLAGFFAFAPPGTLIFLFLLLLALVKDVRIIIGSALVLLALVVALFILRRRRARQHSTQTHDAP